MTKSKTTKKALFASALSLILCFAMLLGTTYAWFTDSVTSANNIIKSGTLDIALEYQSLDNGTWGTKTEITNEAQSTAIFNYDKWEPGYSEVKLVTISNRGTLALKYKLNVVAHLKDGETAVSKLADVIDVYYLELPAGTTSVTAPTSFADAKAEGLVKVGTLADVINNNITTANGALLPAGSTATPTEKEAIGSVSFVMMLHMQEEAGNEYQALSIGNGFDLQLLATQYTEETDSFNDQYDKDAEYLYPVASAADLMDALADGKSVQLTEDIALDTSIGATEGQKITIDLAGNDLTVENEGTILDGTMVGAVGEGSVLNIVSTSDAPVNLTFDNTSLPLALEGGTINLENVNITVVDNAMSDHMLFSGVSADAGGTINFYSGTIDATYLGVCLVNGSTFNMYGGEIIARTSTRTHLKANTSAICAYGENITVNLVGGKITVVDQGYAFTAVQDYIFTSAESSGSLYISKDFVIDCPDTANSYGVEYKVQPGRENYWTITDERVAN